ncbi:PEP-CTERM sorting domain-containing protein [Luteolibacter sp. LG18]|uniref:PEP-CTERM sorting domain-containing protein n=1 Tax=Luteolibacter sp. LG18 TaxID=2819286 RepID=UPI002B313B36|nr:hypothetical protein llg_00100 [Luteolibacter sp. LG18]
MQVLLTSSILAAFTMAAGAATVVVDSTGLTPVNQANFGVGTAGNLSTGAAFTFTTGSLGTDTILSTIGLEGRQTGTGSSGSTLTLEIWSDTDNNSATLGGVLLGTSTNSTALGLNATSLFTFNGVTLSDNTVYTVHVLGTGTPGFGLVGSTSTDLVPNSRLYNNGSFVFGGTAPNGIDASFSVTTVPEPTTALLGGLGLLALLRRRRG